MKLSYDQVCPVYRLVGQPISLLVGPKRTGTFISKLLSENSPSHKIEILFCIINELPNCLLFFDAEHFYNQSHRFLIISPLQHILYGLHLYLFLGYNHN